MQRGNPPHPDDRGGLAAALSRLTDGISRLVSEHMELARAELKSDARTLGKHLMKVAAFSPLLLVGYGFLCAALAVGLSAVIPLWAALLIVGVLNVIVGGAGVASALSKLREQSPVLEDTLTEAQRSAQTLRHAAKDPIPVQPGAAPVGAAPAGTRGNGMEKRLGA